MAARKIVGVGLRKPEQGDIGRLNELRESGMLSGTQFGELLQLEERYRNDEFVKLMLEKIPKVLK